MSPNPEQGRAQYDYELSLLGLLSQDALLQQPPTSVCVNAVGDIFALSMPRPQQRMAARYADFLAWQDVFNPITKGAS